MGVAEKGIDILLANKDQSYSRLVVKHFLKNKMAVTASFVLLAIVLACIFVPVFSPYAMESTGGTGNQPPNTKHWFGTDQIGRDLFTRLFYGGRISLGIAFVITIFQAFIGVTLGSLAGFYGRWVDIIVMRVNEMFVSLPFFLTSITILALFGNNIPTLIAVLSVLGWTSICRIVRGQILALRETDYMQACKALGISDRSQIIRHLFPNVLSYVIVFASIAMANVILLETALSFLGLGISPPTPTWGNMIEPARQLPILQNRWWYWVPPGLAIFTSVMCFNIIGDGLRDAVDPKSRR